MGQAGTIAVRGARTLLMWASSSTRDRAKPMARSGLMIRPGSQIQPRRSCPLLALSGHSAIAVELPLLVAKQTLTNRSHQSRFMSTRSSPLPADRTGCCLSLMFHENRPVMGLFRACSDSRSQGLQVLSKPMFCHPNFARSSPCCGQNEVSPVFSPVILRIRSTRRVRIRLAHQP